MEEEDSSNIAPREWSSKVIIKELRETYNTEMKTLWDKVPEEITNFFCQKYGCIKDLLFISGQKSAVLAFYKYWNPLLRVFSFVDMDLVPTLEEYSIMLEIPLSTPIRVPAEYKESTLLGRLAQIFKVPSELLSQNMVIQHNVQSWSVSFILEHLRGARFERDWDRFINLTALIIYGTLLFPIVSDKVDAAAAWMFTEVCLVGSNPILAILADTIYGLTQARLGRQKTFTGSWILLYVWICFHTIRDERGHFNVAYPRPLAQFHLLPISEESAFQWKQKVKSLNSKTVIWKAPWLRTQRVISNCEPYDCIPLSGTRGHTAYAPQFILRQFNHEQYIPQVNTLDRFGPDSEIASSLQMKEIVRAWRSPSYLETKRIPEFNKTVEGYLFWRQNFVLTSDIQIEEQPVFAASHSRNYEIECRMQAAKIQELERMMSATQPQVLSQQQVIKELTLQIQKERKEKMEFESYVENKKRRYEELRSMRLNERSQLMEKIQHLEAQVWKKEQEKQLEVNYLEIQMEARKLDYETELYELTQTMEQLKVQNETQGVAISQVKKVCNPAYNILCSIQERLQEIEAVSNPLQEPNREVLKLMKKCRQLLRLLEDNRTK